MGRPVTGWRKYRRILWGLSHLIFFTKIGLSLFVVGFACLGAHLLILIEWPSVREQFEVRYNNSVKLKEYIDLRIQTMTETIQLQNFLSERGQGHWNVTSIASFVNHNLNIVLDTVRDCESGGICSRKIPVWQPKLTYPKALMCILSLMTGVDYGVVVTVQSVWGKTLVIVYALFGLPLFYSFLALVANSIRYVLRHIGRKYIVMKPRKIYDPETKMVVLAYPDNLAKDLVFPLPVSALLLVGYIFMGALLFSTLEGWNIIHSFYFAAITISGVGVGEAIPGSSPTEYKGLTTGSHLIALVLFSVTGLALIMVCFQMTECNFLERWRRKAEEARVFFITLVLGAEDVVSSKEPSPQTVAESAAVINSA